MRKHMLAGALSVLLLSAAAGLAVAATGVPATYAEALALAQQQNKILVIDFYADW